MNTSYPDIRLNYTGNTKTHKTVDDNGTKEEEDGNEVKEWYGNATVQKEESAGKSAKLYVQIANWWGGIRPAPFPILQALKAKSKLLVQRALKTIRQPNTGNWQLEHSW